MKVSDILQEGPIYDTPEYELSSKKDQRIAFVAQLPHKEFQALVKELDVEIPTHIKVKLVDDSEHSLKVELGTGVGVSLQPAEGSYKRKVFKGGRNFYIIDGPVSMTPKTKYFTDTSFFNATEYKEFTEKYFTALRKRREEFDKKLQIDLREKLPAAAKKALNDDLLGKIKGGHSEQVRKWFVDAGFKMTNGAELPPASEFKKMNSLRGWTISTKQFGGPNRGVDGVSIDIDWEKKTFGHEGWSSSD
jgi:hypothetical protein